MKKYLTLLVLIIVCACAGPFFIKGPDGKPLLTTSTIFPQGQSSILIYWKNRLLMSIKKLTKETKVLLSADSQDTSVYRWQDAEGNWHYGDAEACNKSGKTTEQVKLKAIQIIDIANPTDDMIDEPTVSDGSSLSEYTERLGSAKSEAEKVKQLMEERNAALKKAG